jgi:hypothetical protein
MSDYPDQWSIRIGAAQEALKRSRYAFLAATIVSGAFVIATYNEAFSWDRQMMKALESDWASTKPPKTGENKPQCDSIGKLSSIPKYDQDHLVWEKREVGDALCNIQKLRTEEIYKRWQKDVVASNSLLGIALNGDDTFLLGGFIIPALLMWSFYAMRRENHIIADLISDAVALKDNMKNRQELLESVFHGVTSYTVFITLSDESVARRSCVDSIHKPKPASDFARDTGKLSLAVAKLSLRAIGFLPVIALMFSVIAHVYTLFDPVFGRICGLNLLECLTPREIVWVLVGSFFSLIGIVVAGTICIQLGNFQEATRDSLRELNRIRTGKTD